MILLLYPTHGFHIRNLFDSGLVSELSRDFKIAVLADARDSEHFRREYGHLVDVLVVPSRSHPIERRLQFVRKRILVKPDRAVTVSVFSEQERRERPIRHFTLGFLNRMLGRFKVARELWLKLECSIIPGREFDQALRDLKPAAIVSSNYGTEDPTIRLLRSARRLRIPSVAFVPSFDNLTSKGVIGARPDHLLVWNETMRREASSLHDFSPDQVAVCGGVQFDLYAQPQNWPAPAVVWEQLKLDVTKPTIVVGTITPTFFPYNIDVIELIAEAIMSGELPRNCQILIRLHPQVVDGGMYGDDLAPYRAVSGRYPFIQLDVPSTRRWHSMQPPAKDDMARLATILSHAAVVVLPASTLALDAAALDTPIVGVAFDGRGKRPSTISPAAMFSFTHYRPITESGAIALAHSPSEMIAAINDALLDRNSRAGYRRRLAVDLLGPRDGGAIGRAIAQIRRAAGKGT